MSTQEKRDEIISKIPDEGQAIVAGVIYTDNKFNAIIEKAFEGKEPAAEGKQSAVILLGSPGSGSSTRVWNNYKAMDAGEQKSWMYVSYDENGALSSIPEYVEDIKAVEHGYSDPRSPVSSASFAQRLHVRDKFRDLSQALRSSTLKKSLHDGLNIIVDTTSSSMGTKYLIDSLDALEFDRIDMQGTFAPFEISLDRIRNRAKGITDEEILKRIGSPQKPAGALNMTPTFLSMVDSLEYYYNPSNDREAVLAFRFGDGTNLNFVDPDVVVAMRRDMQLDLAPLLDFIQESEELQSKGLTAHYGDCARASLESFDLFLERVQKRSPSPTLDLGL